MSLPLPIAPFEKKVGPDGRTVYLRGCWWCGKEKWDRHWKKVRVFCDTSCNKAARKPPSRFQERVSAVGKTEYLRHCGHCGREKWTTRWKPEIVYCDKSCAFKATKGPEFNARISRENAKASGDKQRRIPRGRGNSYVKLNGRHEHRVIAERKLGRPLLTKEVVHHIDGDKKNNDPGNLEILSQREHMLRHGIGVPGQKLSRDHRLAIIAGKKNKENADAERPTL